LKFFSLALELKNKHFPSNHLARYVHISLLYAEAEKRKLKESQWSEFIVFELNQAYKWVSVEQIEHIKKGRKEHSKRKGIFDSSKQ